MTALLVGASGAAASVIVYRCGSPAELCRINPDGTGQGTLTTDGASAAYQGASLDLAGDRMVFTRDTANLFAADANAQHAVGPISTFAQVPKISFDGATAVDDEYFPSIPEYAICTFSTTNPGSDGKFGRACPFAGRFPTFTPGGQIVASILKNGHDEICLYNASGCATDLAVDPTADLDEAAVSPDGRTLAVVATPDGGTAGAGHIALYSMASGQFMRNLTSGPADETPAWSPDGTHIVFARSGSLFTIASAGSPGSEKLLVHGGDTPTWGGGGSTPQPRPVSIQIGRPAKLKSAAFTKHGIVITVRSTAPVAAELIIALDGATARRLGLGHKQVALATTSGVVKAKRAFDLTPGRRFRKKLGAARHFALHIVIVLQDAAGHRSIRSYTVSVNR